MGNARAKQMTVDSTTAERMVRASRPGSSVGIDPDLPHPPRGTARLSTRLSRGTAAGRPGRL